MDRRQWLRCLGAIGVATTAGPFAGCLGSPDGDSGGSGGGATTTTAPETTAGSSSGWTETSTIEMTDDLKFVPKRAQVSKGTTVTWENVGSIGHTVTAYEDGIPSGAEYFASGGFDSEQAAVDGYKNEQKGNIPEGETYEHTFQTTGEYKYYCIPHELSGMIGFVKVV